MRPTSRNSAKVSNIVCPIELSEEAEPLLRFARNVADAFGAKVRLLHVVPEQDVHEYRYFDTDFHRRISELAENEIAEYQRAAGTDFPLSITRGHIAHDAAELAINHNADLMLIGRGKTRAVLGSFRSHAPDIIRLAPCPVLSYSMDWLAKEYHPAALSALPLALQT